MSDHRTDPEILDERLEALKDRVVSFADKLQSERQARRQAEQRVEELERRVEQLEDGQDLIAEIGQNGSNDYDQLAAVAIRICYRDAVDSDPPVGTLNAGSEAKTALQNAVARPNTYRVLRRADELTDSNAVEFLENPRNGGKRLVVDLRDGEMPHTVSGHDVTGTGPRTEVELD